MLYLLFDNPVDINIIKFYSPITISTLWYFFNYKYPIESTWFTEIHLNDSNKKGDYFFDKLIKDFFWFKMGKKI